MPTFSRKLEKSQSYFDFCDDTVFADVLEWMYTGDLELSEENILSITRISILLTIPELTKICERYVTGGK